MSQLRSQRPSRASARVPARFADTASDDDDDDDDDGETNGKAAKNADDLWVCCDRCGKWRSLPSNVEAKRLAKRRWYCTMNPDPERNSCGAAEEDYRSTTRMSAKDRRMQEFLRQWVLRLKKIDAAEARLPRSVVGTRNKKRTSADTGWIQCCNPNCGKYRAVSTALEERVQENDEWFCVMNTWDEALSSCAAPQEIPER
ncbi:CW-type zinc finger-domain-containing protein [Pelagophyceae sp. CCMP2097]|nr:CW-type zinc finger-domain-containing protein [Pelagophyceae sp. CCMP2097]